jgi:hypothetical protein
VTSGTRVVSIDLVLISRDLGDENPFEFDAIC